MDKPQVSVVVGPRERFSHTQRALASILEHTTIPYQLIYVDAGSPTQTRRYLEQQAQEHGFELIRVNDYLPPSRARNLGLLRVGTKYVVFIDNDVVVTPGWLRALVDCANETGAAVVGPLYCYDKPVHEVVHSAGGECSIVEREEAGGIRRHMSEAMRMEFARRVDVEDQLQREQTGLAEMHCMLVQTEILNQLGGIDERCWDVKEHVDLCLSVSKLGGTVYFEPASVVTYIAGPIERWADVPYYMLRWSTAWELAGLRHMRDKWDLVEDEYFQHRYKTLGWRRRNHIYKPLVKRLTFGRGNRVLEKALVLLDKPLNRYITFRYARRQRNLQIDSEAGDPAQISSADVRESSQPTSHV